MGSAQQGIDRDHAFFSLRSISHISIEPARPTCNALHTARATETYDYWDITVTGRSFLYRQVRRIVGVILAVAQDRLRMRNAYEMLTIPSMNSWCSQASAAPAYGLYLVKVAYNENDKLFPKTDAVAEPTEEEAADELVRSQL